MNKEEVFKYTDYLFKNKMKLIHHITLSVFVKKNENKEKTIDIITSLLPENLEKEKIKIEEESIKIENGEDFDILKIKTTKNKHNNKIISILKEILGEEQISLIINDETRVDDEGNLYIRLDKKSLKEKQEAKLVDHGDCYHIKIMIAAYPKTKAKAIEIIKKLFEEQ